jgi:1-deoxy-D-xylulose-5-phosphate reductoisomerase
MSATNVTILGSTGSIGCNTLEVIRHFARNRDFQIVALTGNSNIELLARQAIEFNAQIAVTASDRHYGALKSALTGTGIEAAAGSAALGEAAGRQVDWVMAGIIGIAGLAPTLAAARTGATIALANKECLVSAGQLFLSECARSGAKIIPVDSEHSAIFQVFEQRQKQAVERVILTASGGPFRTWPLERMAGVTPQMAASHPNWSMGLKISIDSATMFNKALEMIEAQHLFGLAPEAIDVIIHPQSIIHSMVSYFDGSTLAQMGCPDMRTAISYALAWPERGHVPVQRLDLAKLARLDFETPDERRFPAIRLAREAMQRGGTAGTVLNAARETALDAFIIGKIGFLDIAPLVEKTMTHFSEPAAVSSIEDIFEIDRETREYARLVQQAVTQATARARAH